MRVPTLKPLCVITVNCTYSPSARALGRGWQYDPRNLSNCLILSDKRGNNSNIAISMQQAYKGTLGRSFDTKIVCQLQCVGVPATYAVVIFRIMLQSTCGSEELSFFSGYLAKKKRWGTGLPMFCLTSYPIFSTLAAKP